MGFFDLFKTKKHDQFDDEGNILCPKCQSVDILEIVFGYPTYETMKDYKHGKIALGGCCIDKNIPRWQCTKCNNRWK